MRPRGRILAAGIVVVVLLIAGAFVLGRISSPSVATPTTTSAAAGFLRDMQVHHAQAVQMSFLIRDRTDDAGLRLIALDIATGQAQQEGQMYALLEAWGLPQASLEPAMTWMSQPVIDGSGDGMTMATAVPGSMPGMATTAQIQQLTEATGVAAERIFLTLMIAHHRGGVQMAKAALARTDVPQVVTLATGIKNAQLAEIETMQQLLAALPA